MHAYTALLAHIVFATQGRRRSITADLRVKLLPYIAGIIRNLGGHALRINAVEDHLHLLTRVPPSIPVADFVGTVKSNSTGWLHKELGLKSFSWQRGYGAFSVSRSDAGDVVRTIEHQEEHHRRRTFDEELRMLLAKHDLEVDVHDADLSPLARLTHGPDREPPPDGGG